MGYVRREALNAVGGQAMSSAPSCPDRYASADFRAIAEDVPALLWMTDPDQKATWFNRTWFQFTGLDPAQDPTLGWPTVIHTEDAATVSACQRAFEERRSFQVELRLRRADGIYRWMIDTATPFYNAEGRFNGFLGSLIDIEDWKAAEEQRRLLSGSMEPSRATAMIAVASMIAHEINQPLTAITNYLRGAERVLAGGNGDRDSALKAIAAAEQCAVRAGEIVRSLRGMIAQHEPVARDYELRRLVEEVLLMADLGPLRRSWIVNQVSPDLQVHIDPVKMQQVVLNLIRNAAEACADTSEPRVIVAAAEGDEGTVLRVIDNGPGVPEDMREQLFDAFCSSKPQGLGIGLAICRAIVEAHGGNIWFEPVAEGTSVVCTMAPAA